MNLRLILLSVAAVVLVLTIAIISFTGIGEEGVPELQNTNTAPAPVAPIQNSGIKPAPVAPPAVATATATSTPPVGGQAPTPTPAPAVTPPATPPAAPPPATSPVAPPPAAPPAGGPTPPPPVVVPPAQAELKIDIRDFAFAPAEARVAMGTKITWTNFDAIQHNAVSDTGLFSGPLLAQGKSYSVTISAPGTYTYHCGPHPNMKGKIIVE